MNDRLGELETIVPEIEVRNKKKKSTNKKKKKRSEEIKSQKLMLTF